MTNNNKTSVTIHTGFGGLGDNLMFSTLPELYANQGIDCFISSMNPYRNEDIRKLVWDSNPYIKGTQELTREQCIGHSITGWIYTPKINGFIENIEYLHQFESVNKYPKIYYECKTNSDLKNAVIVDLSAITRAADANFINEDTAFKYLKETYNYSDDEIFFLRFPNLNATTAESNYYVYEIENLFEYADVLNSCKHYLSLHSGGNMLACAIKNSTLKFINECFIPSQAYDALHAHGHQALFDNCEYLVW